MEFILQPIFSGLVLGAIYALVAVGFSITFSTTATFNFGQGEFLAVGTFAGLSALLLASGGADAASRGFAENFALFGLSALVAGLVAGALGIVVYFIAVRPFLGKPGLSWVLSTLGLGIILQNAALAIWGATTQNFPSPFGDTLLRIGGAGVRAHEVFVIVVCLVVVAALDFMMTRTRLGQAVRAVAFSHTASLLMGINVTAVVIFAFVLSSGLAGVAGVLVAPLTSASVFMGLTLALKGFSAAILGGLTSPRGCVIGAFIIGLAEASIGAWRADLRDIAVFGLIILVLCIRPKGLFGKTLVEKV
ncbi:MAG: branched-chain amino acid ABC transporter permease [Mesorhizobium amorphae]|nr:MAG: branched-chain amino acid ABC transporter permease [Mesorhizobium amorphae]